MDAHADKPLSIGDLTYMDGKPVFVIERVDDEQFNKGEWMVAKIQREYMLCNCFAYWYSEYGKSWIAYGGVQEQPKGDE
jgi:hypothetical protein